MSLSIDCHCTEAGDVADPRTQIVRIMTSLDALIIAETQKHKALKIHKKGLMQQLFPSPEAVEL